MKPCLREKVVEKGYDIQISEDVITCSFETCILKTPKKDLDEDCEHCKHGNRTTKSIKKDGFADAEGAKSWINENKL